MNLILSLTLLDVKLVSTHIISSQFIFAEASLKSPGQRTRLVSPVYEAELSKAACLRLRIMMFGADVGTLRGEYFAKLS